MAHPDDPPYLTVGTEVSAKYRGAFCEATIKIAERLVKCKVSYGKGQSAMVTNDCIKGPLKVGAQVEVKQPDGSALTATLVKVTDNSTYTVVFDDGDERTLKRSSLCLKGGRHFHESESLDHLPLTDPENFGTPVNANFKKPGRRRRHASQSPPWNNTSKKNSRSPSEFTVGKAVFLENDRRRSSWLPAVVVPTHYVLEPSEMTPETICLRSFKDGRYHEATENELHVFSPDKEPLLSMLEGEIQPMFMCKPAIERAMAYLDTGELPWDMDIFNQHPPTTSESRVSELSTSDEEDHHRKNEADSANAKEFYARLKKFHETRSTPIQRQPPMVGQQNLSLHQLYQRVMSIGGMDRVTQEMKWRSVHLQLGLSTTPTSQNLRQLYKKFLYQFELFEKNKAKVAAKEGASAAPSGGGKCTSTADRANKTPGHSTVEERVHPQTPAHSGSKGTRSSGDSGGRMNGLERGKRGHPASSVDTPVPSKRAKPSSTGRPRKVREGIGKRLAAPTGASEASLASSKGSGKVKEVETKIEMDEEEDDKNCSSDTKSEVSDSDPPSVGNTSADNDWTGEMFDPLDQNSANVNNLERGVQKTGIGTGLEKLPDTYEENDRVLVLYGKGKTQRLYEAKVMTVEVTDGKKDYLVHYSGWNNRYNEWIDNARIMGKIVGSMKSRPHFNKRKKSSKNGSKDDLFPFSLLPPSPPTSSNLKSSPHSSRTTPPPNSSSSSTPPPSQFMSSLTPILTVKKEAITDKSVSLSNGKKVSKRNGAMPVYNSSLPLVSSMSPSTEAGSAMAGAGIRLPGRPRGGKADRSKAAKGAGGRVDVKVEPDSTPPPENSAELVQPSSNATSNSSSSSASSSGSSSSNESSNDEEQPTPLHKNVSKTTTFSERSPASKLHEVKPSVLGANSPIAKPPGSSSVKSPSSASKLSPSSKMAATKPLPSNTSSAALKSHDLLVKASNSEPQSPASKPSSTPPEKPTVSEMKSLAFKSTTPVARQQNKQQAALSKELPSSTKNVSKSLVATEHGPVSKPAIALVKMQSPSKPTSQSSKPQNPAVKLPMPEVKHPLDLLSSNPLPGVYQPPALSLSSSGPSQTSTPSRPTINSLICSETLPGLVQRKPQQQSRLLDSPDGSIADSAQSLLSLAMASPIISQNSLDRHMSRVPPSNHISAFDSQSKTSPLLSPSSDISLPEASERKLQESSDGADSEGKDEEEEEDDDEMISETNDDDDEETEDEDKNSIGSLKTSDSSSNKASKLFAPTKSRLDGSVPSSEGGRSVPSQKEQSAVLSPVKNAYKQLSVSSSSCSDGKRKWREFETSEEYERRKKTRHADMNYLVNFADLPDMSSVERISLIQGRLREIQRRWSDLKAELAYIERKKKRAKRKGKVNTSQGLESSPRQQQQQQQQPQPQPQLHATISCH